ncbi:hypothetical protein SAMN04487968_10622 [Nocardioides terrae]|uniref:Uncharacterized protein n=1 Tax=Nocardioides terrae TaxID=574651 RepID=A0A1I1IXP7_9ACTN|nr:hypothetical protein [Nocardioides terrae]SFC38020.1 hypothetical protein SAMN04487968_10622 [Nocardioides terrae]
MSSQHKAPLAAFFVVSIACIVVVVNALRSDALAGIFVRPTQAVIAGALLVPAPQDILSAEAKVVTKARTALSVARTVVDEPARVGAAEAHRHQAGHATAGSAEVGTKHVVGSAQQATASAPAAAAAPVTAAAPAAPALVPVKHTTPGQTTPGHTVRPPVFSVTHPIISSHLPEAPAAPVSGHTKGRDADQGRGDGRHGLVSGLHPHLGLTAPSAPAGSGIRSGHSYGVHSLGPIGFGPSSGHPSSTNSEFGHSWTGYGHTSSSGYGNYGHSSSSHSSSSNGWRNRH